MDRTTSPDNVKTSTHFAPQGVGKIIVRRFDTYASGRVMVRTVVGKGANLTWSAAKLVAKALERAYNRGKLDSGNANGDSILPKRGK